MLAESVERGEVGIPFPRGSPHRLEGRDLGDQRTEDVVVLAAVGHALGQQARSHQEPHRPVLGRLLGLGPCCGHQEGEDLEVEIAQGVKIKVVRTMIADVRSKAEPVNDNKPA